MQLLKRIILPLGMAVIAIAVTAPCHAQKQLIDMLPNGRIVAAASTIKGGNCIMLFDPAKGNLPMYTDSLYSGHGAVWDAGRQSFCIGI